MAKTVNLKTLQVTLDRVSVHEFMKLPKEARAAFETLYDGLSIVVPRKKGATIAPPQEAPQPEPSSYPGPVPGVSPPGHVPRFPEIPGASLIPGRELSIPPPEAPRGTFESEPPPEAPP
jgi:hypothetical protein